LHLPGGVRTLDAGTRKLSHGAARAWQGVIATGASPATLPLRLVLGLIFFAHGSQKLFGLFGGPGLNAAGAGFEQMGFAPGMLWAFLTGAMELGGGILLLLGLLTRVAAGGLSLVMLVAMFAVHWRNGFFLDPAGPRHGIEFVLALLGGLIALLIYGGGWASGDRQITRTSFLHQPPPSAP
jgi:putative oxidoreductase